MKKRIAILGATESVGKQALAVVSQHPGLFEAEVLSTHDQADLIIQQAQIFQPNTLVVTEEAAFEKVKSALSEAPVKVFFGQEALSDVVTWDTLDVVLMATTGFDSLRPVLAAINAGKAVAMANKEVMAAAGNFIRRQVLEKETVFLPVNNALSSIFQCLIGEDNKAISKVTLMASGGPFLDKKPNFLVNVKRDHALQDANRLMDEKALIDSSSLMNKGLEMMAAKWLFGLEDNQLDVLIHPQSAIQSLVQFRDGSVKTQIGLPDIHIPLLYALTYPERVATETPGFTFHDVHKFTFEEPDVKTFHNLRLAREAMERGHNAPCILNAANEIVVQAFLNNRVGFIEMSEMIEKALTDIPFIENPTLEDLEKTDAETRKLTLSLTKNSQLFS